MEPGWQEFVATLLSERQVRASGEPTGAVIRCPERCPRVHKSLLTLTGMRVTSEKSGYRCQERLRRYGAVLGRLQAMIRWLLRQDAASVFFVAHRCDIAGVVRLDVFVNRI